MIDAHIEYQGEYSYEHLMEYVQAAIHNGIDEITILQPTHKFKECSLLYREICASYPCQKEWYDRIEKNLNRILSSLYQRYEKTGVSYKDKFWIACLLFYTA